MFEINQQKSERIHGRIRFPDGTWRQVTSGCSKPELAADVFVTMQYFMNQSNKPKNSSRQALLKFMRSVYQEKFHEDCPLMLTDTFVQRFCGTNEHYVADSTQVQTSKTVEWYLKFLQREGLVSCLLEDNCPPLIKRFGEFLVKEGKHSIESANVRLEKLESVFGAAVSEQLISKNPVKGIRLKDRNAESEEELEIHQPYTKAHVNAGIDRGIAPGCNPELAIFQLLSIDAGARGGDVFAFNRAMFHRHQELAKNYLKYYARKPKKWHKVYPYEETVRLLQEYCDHHLLDPEPTAMLFPTFGLQTGPDVPDVEFNNGSAGAMMYFGKYLDALNIRVLLSAELEGRASYSHSTHSGRVTCVTMAAQYGIAESITCARVIHHGREVHRIYQKHSPEAVQRAISGAFNQDGTVNVTLDEFKAAVTYATERLRSLRGQLNLCEGSLASGDKLRRALLQPMQISAGNSTDK